MPDITIAREQLIQKIKNSLFLKEETKEKLITIIDQLTLEDKQGLMSLLEQGEQKEREMLIFLIEKDPDFPSKLKHFMQLQIRAAFKEQEAKERGQDHSDEENLLHQLDEV